MFYSADQEQTAVAEVRPHRGLVVSVCEDRVRSNLAIIDLNQRIELPNPFLTENMEFVVEVVELLNAFAKDLAVPLRRDDDLDDYLSSQSISQIIESAGYAGIRYPSAMSPQGSNLVIFDPSLVEIKTSRLVQVVGTDVEIADA